MSTADFCYTIFPSDYGSFGIVWQHPSPCPRIHRIFLPSAHPRLRELIHHVFPHSRPGSCPTVDTLGNKIHHYLGGVFDMFSLQHLALEQCSSFQKRVLLAEYQVPRGWVTTYGRLASYLQTPGGARAVGRALSYNPFPIVIPCHRTVRSSGDIGGFGGEFSNPTHGRKLKQVLLELEGVPVSPGGKVLATQFYY